MSSCKITKMVKEIKEIIFDFNYKKIKLNKNCTLYVKEYQNELGDICLSLNVYYDDEKMYLKVSDIVYISNSNLTEEETYIFDEKNIYICDDNDDIRSIFNLDSKSMTYSKPSKLII